VSDLRIGDRLRTQGETVRTVTALQDRRGLANQRVYDLTVDELHTFYVVAGNSPILVHNCSNIVADAQKFAGQAHIIDEHTAVSLQRANQLADKKGGPNGVFTDLATAQRVVDHVLATKGAEITKWMRGTQQQKTLRGSIGTADESLGWVAHGTGKPTTKAGNQFVIILKRAPGHKPGGFYVFTGYPV
jgi:hypothetical protein